ncbi:MAG: phosphotransferase [Acidobacteria bacterium]|nr:phosphotransferase [Acidobacteriota bacterium]
MMNDSVENPDEFLYRTHLLKRGETAQWTPLAGGVSSDIWRVRLPRATVCVKRALAKLRVAADWRAPVERNLYEWEWFNFVHENFPGLVPRPVAHDAEMQMLAMEFLAPEDSQVWKTDLLKGKADAGFAARVGAALGKIHARSAFDPKIAEKFATDELFYALRIEPYLLATAGRHPDLAPSIETLARETLAAKIALVHGDVSPKNILVGRRSPIFLDAETAWFGDPAFDPAFCLNHFLLKAVYRPASKEDYFECFRAFSESYLNEVTWEPRAALEKRIARLLPVLHLARVDGKSPVEYITDEDSKSQIRAAARRLIREPAENLASILC